MVRHRKFVASLFDFLNSKHGKRLWKQVQEGFQARHRKPDHLAGAGIAVHCAIKLLKRACPDLRLRI